MARLGRQEYLSVADFNGQSVFVEIIGKIFIIHGQRRRFPESVFMKYIWRVHRPVADRVHVTRGLELPEHLVFFATGNSAAAIIACTDLQYVGTGRFRTEI